ncbi:serine-rich adhesin for platelets-like [Argopecten irradians]|uniref:serine-rich adhesin for platelets-like n=1 Tax=Argopecten irradians TaxID=31199 RepID=UPI003714B07C
MGDVCDDDVSMVTRECDDRAVVSNDFYDGISTQMRDKPLSMVTDELKTKVSMTTNVCMDTVPMVTEVCDDTASIVTNTTRNSDDNDDRSVFDLPMLNCRKMLPREETDDTLSPVLPSQSTTQHYKLQDVRGLSDVEHSDQESVLSESLLRNMGLNCGSHIDSSKNISESQATQLLFDDTQSSDLQNETLLIQAAKKDLQHASGSSDSQGISSNDDTRSRGSSIKRSETTDLGSSGNTKDFPRCVSWSSKDDSSQTGKGSDSCSSQSSRERDCLTRKSAQSDAVSILITKEDEPVHIPNVNLQNYSKSKSPFCGTQSSGEIHGKGSSHSQSSGAKSGRTLRSNSSQGSDVPGTISSQSSYHNSRNTDLERMSNNRKTARGTSRVQVTDRKLDSDEDQSSSWESPRKYQRIQKIHTGDGEQKHTFASQKETHESQSTVSPYITNQVRDEQDQEEAIFRKIVKQQEYVDKQLRKPQLADAEKLKLHIGTLQLLLRKLSDQHKSQRQRLTADVRAKSKTKQNRLRYKDEIEQLGKRQKQLIKLVQRQKMLSSKLKNFEHLNGNLGCETTTAIVTNKTNHQESQTTGSSQLTIALERTGTGMPDTQSTLSSHHTTESFSQSLLLGCNTTQREKKDITKAGTLPQTFNNNHLIDKTSTENFEQGCSSVGPLECVLSLKKSNLNPCNAHDKELTASSGNKLDQGQHISRAIAGSGQVVNRTGPEPSGTYSEKELVVKKTSKTPSQVMTGKQYATANTKLNDVSLKPVAIPGVMIRALAPVTKPTHTKPKPTFIPPTAVRPHVAPSPMMLSPPLTSHQRIPSNGPLFKSPTVQNPTYVDNISPSTASCSDVFPVKSTEISRRIQQRRLLAESQRQQTATECDIPVYVPQNEFHTEQNDGTQTTTVIQEESEEPLKSQVQTKYPSLTTLIDRGILVSAKDCLVTESKNGRFVGSLMDSGLIRGPGGEVFKTPAQWVSAVNDGVLVKKRRGYREVFYQGRPLLSYVDPSYKPAIDLTYTIDEPLLKRSPSEDVVKENKSVTNTQTALDLETLLWNCTVKIIPDSEIVPSSDLPENFWSVDFSSVRIPIGMQEEIDRW